MDMTTKHQFLGVGRHSTGPWPRSLGVQGLCSAGRWSTPSCHFSSVTPGLNKLAEFTYHYQLLKLCLLIGIHILQKLDPEANRYSKLFSINQHNLCWFSRWLSPIPPQSCTSSLCGHSGAHVEQPQQLRGQLGVGRNFACPHGLLHILTPHTFFSTPGSCKALLIYHLKSVFI